MRNELIDLYKLACANPQDKDIVRAYQSARDRICPQIAIHEALDNDALRARVAKLEEALTPSADTKAAYMGEFSFCISEFDEDGEEFARVVDVPWTTIKDIMEAIARRALEEK